MFLAQWISKEEIEGRALDLIRRFDAIAHKNLLTEAKGIDPKAYLEFLVEEEELATYTADLGKDILGKYNFSDLSTYTGRNTIVLSRELTEDHPQRSFTIAHEIGHFHNHHPLYAENCRQLSIFTGDDDYSIVCHRKHLELQRVEPINQQLAWLEWQANYYAACLLLPSSSVLKKCREFIQAEPNNSRDALIRYLTEIFYCSKQCVAYRLNELNIQGLP